jgi:NAD(P)-dependent dehydrogenase (short-subunit alcohol dehydrogenase family)
MPAYRSDGNGPSREELLADYLRLSREAVLAHRDVMLSVLGDGTSMRPATRPLELAEARSLQHPEPCSLADVPPTPDQTSVASPAPAPLNPDDLSGLVVTAISESTGYPADMIELDLDLEGELGIDSIGRAEIAAKIALKLGQTVGKEDDRVEDLIKVRTARAIVAWLGDRTGGAPTDRQVPLATATDPVAAGEQPGSSQPDQRLCRLLPKLVTSSLSRGQPRALYGAWYLITGDTRVGDELATALRNVGALASTWRPGEGSSPDLGEADGLIVLDGLAGSGMALPISLFPAIKAALSGTSPPGRQGLCRLLVAGALAEPSSAGLAGLLRTVDLEHPEAGARYVAFDRIDPADDVASRLLAELLSDVRTPAVTYRHGVRHLCELAPAELLLEADDYSDAAAARAIGLDQDSVVAVVGGARGIAAGIARTFAALSGSRIELIGRTAPPPDAVESADTSAAVGLRALRAALAARSTLTPAEVNRSAETILAQREVRETLDELRALGSPVSYRSADVRDQDATRQAIAAVCGAHGRIDGLVFAAGIIEDALITAKSPESFARVFDTKVAGARAVLDALDDQGCEPRFTVLFGGLSAWGSRGQADYAAANDALEALSAQWSARAGRRCLTVHWGPWAPAGAHHGMVRAQLARQFVKRGLGLIGPDQGVRCLLRELAWGDPAITSVAYTAPADGTAR